jgi:mRNA interferase YafQ
MALEIRYTSQFKKDLKRIRTQPKDLDKLKAVLDLLVQEIELPEKNRDHNLIGIWLGYKECHVSPDLLLIYKVSEGELSLARVGTHSQLFR